MDSTGEKVDRAIAKCTDVRDLYVNLDGGEVALVYVVKCSPKDVANLDGSIRGAIEPFAPKAKQSKGCCD